MRRRAVASAAPGAPQRIRIIGGRWKRTPIDVSGSPGVRPTPDRVRETLFNWLGQRLDGKRCLDPFAGTGVLGFEAASRGAAHVVLVERDREAAATIARTIERLQASRVELIRGDAFETMRRLAQAGRRFDLVFLDPPFAQNLLEPAIALLPPILAAGALVHVETGAAFEAPSGWQVVRAERAGQVRYHLMHLDEDRQGDGDGRRDNGGDTDRRHDGDGNARGDAA